MVGHLIHTELRVITVRWQNRWLRKSLFSIQDGKEQRPLSLADLPAPDEVHLRFRGAANRFGRFLRASNLSTELAGACESQDPVAVLYDLEDGPWSLPWELAFESLPTNKMRNAYTPARIAGSLKPLRPWKHAEKLRVLILEGHRGEVPNLIRPDLEAAGIVEAWEGLDLEARARIEKPKRALLDANGLAELLLAEQPHIVWYCGHGRSTPSPGLLYGKDAWMSVKDFAAAVPRQSPPLCVALWACELGEASPDQEATAPAPEIHSALASYGVRATLAVQSRINDIVARNMARELFTGLAMGLSLECAAARARRAGYTLPNARYDWASPAVWLAQAPTTRWEWGAVPSDLLLERLVAGLTVKQTQKTVDIEPRTVEASRTAEAWSQHQRTVVSCDLGSEAIRIELSRIADAVFNDLNSVPVFINMAKVAPIASIRDWANEIRSWCEPEMLQTALGKTIEFAISDAYSTPRRLLELESCMLVFINPPTDNDSDWFLSALAASRRSAPIVLIIDTPLTDPRFEEWTKDTLMTGQIQRDLEKYLEDEPAAVAAMAVLDLPLPENTLSSIGFSRDKFPRGATMLFETRFGPILADWAKRMVLERVTADQVLQAHIHCVEMLRAVLAGRPEKLGRELLRHLVGARQGIEALAEAASAIETSFLEERFAMVVELYELLKPLGELRRSLDTLALLRVAEAYVYIGKPRNANLVLQYCKAENALQEAAIFALRSEIEKNDGTVPGWRERAIDFMNRAIESARQAVNEPLLSDVAAVVLMNNRMNLARLQQYLNYDLATASKAYRELLQELGGTSGQEVLIASIERNLADCVLDSAADRAAAEQEVQGLLDDANARLPDRHPLRGEIAYVRAKLAESKNGTNYEKSLETSAILARQNGNGMVEAIADARIFWAQGHFDLERWKNIEISLMAYRYHGWAFRTTLNQRIHAARTLAQQGQKSEALALLRKNQREGEARPAFNHGSDRDRIGYTLAGILTLDPNEADRQRVTQYIWLVEWLQSKNVQTLEEAWERG